MKLHSYKFKKPGIRTQIVADMNKIVIFISGPEKCGCGYTLKSCGCPLNFRVVVRALFMTITKVRVTAIAKK